MGVSWVFHYQGNMLELEIGKRLEGMGAEKKGHFLVDATQFAPNQEIEHMLNSFHICHHSEYPATSFAMVGDNLSTAPHAVADTQLDQLLGKMQAYSGRINSTIESRGTEFEIEDFAIRVGSVSVASNFKGILIEVEYRPCFVPAQCDLLMREFCEGLFSPLQIPLPPSNHPNHFQQTKFKAGQSAAPIDTMVQYMELFNALRKQVAAETLSGGTTSRPPSQQQMSNPQVVSLLSGGPQR